VRLKARAALVDANGVMLDNGERIQGATVICTIGTRPNPLAERLGLALQRGRIVTAADMSVPEADRVWAVGDCALVRNHAGDAAGAGHSPLAMPAAPAVYSPPTAQFAVAQAHALAHNILARIEQRPTRPFSHVSKGMMATTGHLKGVAQVAGLHLTGLPAWLLWRAYYLLRMPTLGRKLRIWVEWTWGMFFAADITHLRFIRTHEADVPDTPPAGAALAASPSFTPPQR
jgi:NADH dehydrogenase